MMVHLAQGQGSDAGLRKGIVGGEVVMWRGEGRIFCRLTGSCSKVVKVGGESGNLHVVGRSRSFAG